MTTYYVDNVDGDDANAGTSEGSGNAWASIGKAMQTVAAGDHVGIKVTGTDYTVEDGSTDSIGAIITAGTAASPIIFEAYTTTLGDRPTGSGRATLDASTNSLVNCIETSLSSALY